MVPETAKTTILFPFASAASLKLPGPLSSRLDTIKTLPPLPPVVYLPNPSAPEKAMAGLFASGDVMIFDGWAQAASKRPQQLFMISMILFILLYETIVRK
jgi:predicted dienelactone hydrolase